MAIHRGHSTVTPEHDVKYDDIKSRGVKVSVFYSPVFKMLHEQAV